MKRCRVGDDGGGDDIIGDSDDGDVRVRSAHADGVGVFPESGGGFSHTHFSAFLCIRMHFSAFYCIFRALGRAAFYKSVTF